MALAAEKQVPQWTMIPHLSSSMHYAQDKVKYGLFKC